MAQRAPLPQTSAYIELYCVQCSAYLGLHMVQSLLLYFSLLILTAIIMTFKNIKAYSSHALTILHVSFQQLAILAVHADGLERHRAVEAHFSGFTVHAFD